MFKMGTNKSPIFSVVLDEIAYESFQFHDQGIVTIKCYTIVWIENINPMRRQAQDYVAPSYSSDTNSMDIMHIDINMQTNVARWVNTPCSRMHKP